MSSSGRMSLWDGVDLYFRRWKRSIDSFHSRRRVLLVLLVITAIILYIGSSFFRWLLSENIIIEEKSSLDTLLRPYRVEERRCETFITKIIDGEKRPSADPNAIRRSVHGFIGNGKFGLDVDRDSPVFIKGKRALELELPFHPIINVDVLDSDKEYAEVLRIVEGVVQRITTFTYMFKTATVLETIYSHRLISSLLIQEIIITNPSDVPLVVHLKRSGWMTGKKQQMKSETFKSSRNVYSLHEGEIRVTESNKVIGYVVAAPDIQDSIEVSARSKKSLMMRTFINYTSPQNPTRGGNPLDLTDLKSSIRRTTKYYEELLSTSLFNYHKEAWHNLWQTGFGISLSKASGALNGDVINATIYYILSHKSSFSADTNFLDGPSSSSLSSQNPSNPEKRTNFLLDHPDRCYAKDSTLQAPNLWSNLDTHDDVLKIVNLWLLTLEKNGCRNLLEAGAEGTLQAIILSFVGMTFHQNHLEMGIHPKELHRDYYLRRIRYSNSTNINITMSVGDDNKASIYVRLDKNLDNKDFYACDAGCLDPPVKISTEYETQFPVKITEPLTPILYVTSNKMHIQELKHAIHVKEVAVAPAHENHVIALHRHGSRLGGLPTLFWISICTLVVIFHLFLFKYVYDNFVEGDKQSSSLSSSSSAPLNGSLSYSSTSSLYRNRAV